MEIEGEEKEIGRDGEEETDGERAAFEHLKVHKEQRKAQNIS